MINSVSLIKSSFESTEKVSKAFLQLKPIMAF